MAAIAKNPAFAKKAGVPQSVGADFIKADTGRKFAKGGETMATKKAMPKGLFGDKGALAKHAAKPASKAHAGLKAGGTTKMARGGGVESKGKTKCAMVKMAGGGTC
jgi:hypothetical protein